MQTCKLLMNSVILASLTSPAFAADELKPFLAAPAQSGATKDVAEQIKGKLKDAGLSVVGEYSPSGSVKILAVTNDSLKKAAAKGERSAYGATARVSLAEKDGKVSITCTNPEYFAAAYKMGTAGDVKKALETAVECKEPFGGAGMSAADLASYHYAVGMEYLDDVYALGELLSFDDAKKVVEAGLSNNKHGIKKIYRIEIPGKNQVVYGVALPTAKTNKDADDGHIMSVLNQGGESNRYAYLPYEILVNDKKVEALHMRYRAALYFPQLPMLGSGASFFKLQASPDAVAEVLGEVVVPK